MKVKYDWDGCPLCPDCEIGMDYESPKDRDLETMGGYNIQYYYCEKCNQSYELIDNNDLYPSN
jgi:hypothetical protein